MTKRTFWNRMKYQLIEPHYPRVGIEINSDAIRIAAITEGKSSLHVSHLDAEALPEDSIEINPLNPNIKSLDVVAESLRSLWARNPQKIPKICLLLQDRCALTFQVTMEHLPSSREECLELIRFKLRKSIPFRAEEAQISYFDNSGNPSHASPTLWVTVMNRAVVQQYEELVSASIPTSCGLIDLSTFNLINLANFHIQTQGLQQEDHLYINLNRNYIAIAITRMEKLMFYRCRELERRNGLLEEALEEIYPTTLFYVDKLGGKGLSQAFVYSFDDATGLSSGLKNQIGLDPILLNPYDLIQTKFDRQDRGSSYRFTPLLGTLVSKRILAL